MKKTILISIGIGLVAFVIGVFIYFAAGISATYPPIKEYKFSGNVDQLISGMREYTIANPEMILKKTDTTGNKKNGYAFYFTIEKTMIEYSLECENDISNGSTLIQLVSAYDKARNVGGYSKEAKGIDGLVKQFELDVLKPLADNHNLRITAL
jgi:hypothetical protein